MQATIALGLLFLASLVAAQCPSALQSGLSSASGYSFKSTQSSGSSYDFVAYPCVPSTSSATCGTMKMSNTMLCQSWSGGNKAFGGQPAKVSGSSSSGYTIVSANGQSCSAGGNYVSTIALSCDSKQTTPEFDDSYSYTSSKCAAGFKMYAAAACSSSATTTAASSTSTDGTTSAGPAPAGKKKKEGLSVGSILCIVLLLVTVVYLVAGMAYQFKIKGARGLDMLPNRAFWGSLPGLIKDGFLFTFAKARGKTYSALP